MDSVTKKYLNKLLNVLPEKKLEALTGMISQNKITKNSTTYDFQNKLGFSPEEIKITKQILT